MRHRKPPPVGVPRVAARRLPSRKRYGKAEHTVDIFAGTAAHKRGSGKDSRAGGVPASLSRRAAVVNPPKVSSSGLAAWVRRLLADARLEMEPDAVALLLRVCKDDLAAIEQEMDKVLSAFAPGSVIDARALEFLVEPRLEESIFNLLRALGEGQPGPRPCPT